MVSKSGKQATYLVAWLRIVSSLSMMLVLIVIANLIADSWVAERSPLSATTWAFLTVGTLGAALGAFGEKLVGGLSARAEERRLRGSLLDATFALGPAGFGEGGADQGQVVNLLTDGTERFTEYRQAYLGSTLASLVVPVLVLGYLVFAVDPVTGLLLLGLFLLAPLLIVGFMGAFRKTSSNSRRERERLSGGYLDALRNLVPISLLGAGERTERKLREQGERNRVAIMRLLARNQIVIIVTDGLFSLLLICAAAAVVIWRADAGAVSLGEAISVMLLTALLIEPLSQVAGFFYVGMGGLAAGRAIKRHLGREALSNAPRSGLPTQQVPADELGQLGLGLEQGASEASQPGPGSAISAQNLSLDYGRGAVFENLDVSVAFGEKLAIIGPSGQGKSTLLRVLRGMLEPSQGSVEVNGIQLADLSVADRRRLVAAVNQSTWLFTGTVAENLAIANPEATETEMWAALERAHLAETVRRMPQGLHSDVGERGSLLSGGEAQRLSLARAFLSGRRILVLDEPTSQVDAESEDQIASSLETLDENWTILLATHRPRLLRGANHTVRMENGRLEEAHDG